MSSYGELLLVEDDVALAQWVKEFLENEGFSVTHIINGDEVLPTLIDKKFDLVLLDLMLPGLNGLEVCKEIRRISQIPVIMLTARAEEIDEVIGLEIGANDYLAKPVKPRVLLARLKSALRITNLNSATAQNELIFGALKIHKSSKRVIFDGESISLTSGLFDFLCLLAENAGEVVSREKVFQELKSREYDGLDRRFDVMISTLRKHFNENDRGEERIKTVWGKGYLFVPDAW
ncbi:response regulator [Glaciecola sp. KUL10]|uniref:response regulator n=1 Tax=Glaciecola sp. (strain KUL10) TaxID=2161813 RepID=UPI000D78BF1B|nr:response regulator transcription factor [Glaciecola sp. KUL10]GBL05902.1 DNA-binding response regulator [Glaciecola sp. KUL10]